MKHIFLTLGMAAMLVGLCSCDTYVAGPGYVGGPRPGYSRPGYAWNTPAQRAFYGSRPRVYAPPHRHHSHSYYRPSSYRSNNWPQRSDWNRGRPSYYNRDRARTDTRVRVGPVGVSNRNFIRL